VTSEQHESAIRSATALLPTCGEAYRRGNGQLRREYNLAWFEQIRFSTKDGKPHIARVERTGLISALRTAEIAPNGTKPKATHKPFETVLHIAHDVAEPVHSERPGSLHYRVSSLVRGSKVASLVELRGLEPLTPCMPCRCATSCATAPSSRLSRTRTYATASRACKV
jgi:hypothetical protein